MPIVSEQQRKAMYAALHGHSTLGIPKSVAEEYISKDEMPETAEELLRLCGADEAVYDEEQDKAFGDWMADHYQNGLAEDMKVGPRSKPDYNDIVDESGKVIATYAISKVAREKVRLEKELGKKLFLRLSKTSGDGDLAQDAGLPSSLQSLWSSNRDKIQEIFVEKDPGSPASYWLYLKPGWICKAMGCGTIHESSVSAVLSKFKTVQKDGAKDRDLAQDELLLAMDRHPSDIALKGRDGLAFDFKTSRNYTPEGHLHVEQSNISKANVSPYRGSEIPNHQGIGLDPDKIYQLLRDPKELEKGASTFNNKPILSRHVPVDADEHDPELVNGSVSNVNYEHPYLKGDLGLWRRSAIDDVESKKKQQLSSAYRYRADMTPGVYEGAPYHGVMRDIVGNHVAQVKDGRAGDDVVVGDEKMKEVETAYDSSQSFPNEKPEMRKRILEIRRLLQKNPDRETARKLEDEMHDLMSKAMSRDKDLAQDSKEKSMTKKVLSRTAVAVQGALAVYLAPKWSKDAKVKLAMDAKPVDIASLLSTVSAKSFKKEIPNIVKAVTKAVKPFLAQDADLSDLGKALDALKPEMVTEGKDVDVSSGLPKAMTEDDDDEDDMDVDDVSADAEPMAKVMQFLKGKIADEDMAKVQEMCAGAGMDKEPSEEELAKGPPTKEVTEDEDEKEVKEGKPFGKDADMKDKVTKKEMAGAMDAALKKNSAEVEARTIKRMNGITEAKAKVLPLVGELTMAFDSAEKVYEHVLKSCDLELKGVDSSAFPLLIDQQIALKGATSKGRVRVGEGSGGLAMDSKSNGSNFAKRYPNAAKIEV